MRTAETGKMTAREARQKAAECELLAQGAADPVSKAIFENMRDMWIALAAEGELSPTLDLSAEHQKLLSLLEELMSSRKGNA